MTWGVTIDDPTTFTFIASVEYIHQSGVIVGSFTDLLGPVGLVIGPAPESTPAVVTSVGSFLINPGSLPGDLSQGFLVFTYDLFSESPNINPDSLISAGNNRVFDVSVQAQAAAAVPEPSSALLILFGAIAIAALRTRRRLTLLCLLTGGLFGATVTPPFVDSSFVPGLTNPTAMTFAPDGRIFVCEQAGTLRVIKNGALLANPFLTVATDINGERGLLGVAFDPNFASNNFVYIYYTVPGSPPHNRVSRFTASGDTGGSELPIFDLDNLSSATNHNGGAIHFGPDGKLYVAAGENANSGNSQLQSNALGKILRINSDGSIPADNPFLLTASGKGRAIWAMGLRNPFTFSFQPGTGPMHINDVGQNNWEEINLGVAKANYGWPTTEGAFNPATFPLFTNPIYSYPHVFDQTGGCAIVGSTFYNPVNVRFPADWVGRYFFSDLCVGWIRYYDIPSNTSQVFALGTSTPVDLAVGDDGAFYYLERGTGSVRRIQYAAPLIQTHPQSQTAGLGQPATFQVAASGFPVLNYVWKRNNTPIPGAANSFSYTLPAAAVVDDGAHFTVDVSNTFGLVTSNAATLTVNSQLPALVAVISAKTGLPNSRLWTVTIRNFGAGGAASVKLNSLSLTQTLGPACTPVLTPPPFPISFGTINPSASADSNVTIDFSSCAAANRFRVDMAYEANGGVLTGTKTLYNQFR